MFSLKIVTKVLDLILRRFSFNLNFSNFIYSTLFHSLVRQTRSSVVKYLLNFSKKLKEVIRLNLKQKQNWHLGVKKTYKNKIKLNLGKL